MPDILTPTQRHRCMSHIRSKATKPEILVRKWLWAHGYRYRLNVKSVPGKPDIVMRKYRTALCQRLFLARSRGMQAVCPAKDQYRFLAGQDNPQPRTRPTELQRTDASRLASHRHLGMQPHQLQTGIHHANRSFHPEQKPLKYH